MYTLYQNDINPSNMLRMAILGQTLIWQGLTHFFVTLWDCIKIYIGSEPAIGGAAFQNEVIDSWGSSTLTVYQRTNPASLMAKRSCRFYRYELLPKSKSALPLCNVYVVDVPPMLGS